MDKGGEHSKLCLLDTLDQALRSVMLCYMFEMLSFHTLNYELSTKKESWSELNKLKFRGDALPPVFTGLPDKNAGTLQVFLPTAAKAETVKLDDNVNVAANFDLSCNAPNVLLRMSSSVNALQPTPWTCPRRRKKPFAVLKDAIFSVYEERYGFLPYDRRA